MLVFLHRFNYNEEKEAIQTRKWSKYKTGINYNEENNQARFSLTFWNAVTNLSFNKFIFLVYLSWIPQLWFLRHQSIYWILLKWWSAEKQSEHSGQNGKSTYFKEQSNF